MYYFSRQKILFLHIFISYSVFISISLKLICLGFILLAGRPERLRPVGHFISCM